jgi:hypothetical protein
MLYFVWLSADVTVQKFFLPLFLLSWNCVLVWMFSYFYYRLKMCCSFHNLFSASSPNRLQVPNQKECLKVLCRQKNKIARIRWFVVLMTTLQLRLYFCSCAVLPSNLFSTGLMMCGSPITLWSFLPHQLYYNVIFCCVSWSVFFLIEHPHIFGLPFFFFDIAWCIRIIMINIRIIKSCKTWITCCSGKFTL